MIFNSLQFLVFFLVVVVVNYSLPFRFRWAWLLVASFYFYMAFIPIYALVLVGIILIDFIAAFAIEKSQGKKRKLFLLVSIIANCGVLAIFKYYNFGVTNIQAIAHALGFTLSLSLLTFALPIGLSFHTFQAMSYTIEVYRGKVPAERHLGIYALYVLFFPQLVAGPIERPQNIIPQFYQKHPLTTARLESGLRRMLGGFFKKIVIADTLGPIVDRVFNYPTQYSGLPLVIASVLFTIQLYCDFSGYSDIAVGAARILGIRLMENFNRPYAATTIADFWRRWHISLSSWFREYIYIPLGGNRVSSFRQALNVLIVFSLSGLWHGANWTYILWGALHGFFLIIGRTTKNFREFFKKIFPAPLQHLYKQLVVFSLVGLAFIFFRANSIGDAVYILKHLGVPSKEALFTVLGTNWFVAVTIGAALIGMGIVEYFSAEQPKKLLTLFAAPPWVRAGIYSAVLLWILCFGNFGTQPFIYFQF